MTSINTIPERCSIKGRNSVIKSKKNDGEMLRESMDSQTKLFEDDMSLARGSKSMTSYGKNNPILKWKKIR